MIDFLYAHFTGVVIFTIKHSICCTSLLRIEADKSLTPISVQGISSQLERYIRTCASLDVPTYNKF